jgi:hypothetical protein
LTELVDLFKVRSDEEVSRIAKSLDLTEMIAEIEDRFNSLTTAIEEDDDQWKLLIPGRPLLHQFSASTGLGIGRAKTAYVKAAEKRAEQNPFREVINIFELFNSVLA